MEIKGLRNAISELKLIESNNNFARIYVGDDGKVFACEYTDHMSGHYNSDKVIEIMTYDGRVRYGKKDNRPTMAEIKSAAEKALSIQDGLLTGIDFTEEDYNKVNASNNVSFDGFINNIVKITMSEGGTVEDAVFIANDAFRQL